MKSGEVGYKDKIIVIGFDEVFREADALTL
jgi:hypothetical protein